MATFTGDIANARLPKSAATTNATLVRAGSTYVFKIRGYSTRASLCYLKLYDLTVAPTVGTDVPKKTLALPPTSTFLFDTPGMVFQTGLAFAITVSPEDAATDAVALGDVVALDIEHNL